MSEELSVEELRQRDYLRGRRDAIREVHADGRMNGRAAANELLLLLPEGFAQAYERLFWTALIDPNKGKAGDPKDALDIARGTTGTVLGSETRLQASGSGKKFKNTGFVVGSEKALKRKTWVDQKLSDLASDILASLNGERLNTQQCVGAGCRRMLDRKWRFCPNCGTRRGGKERGK